MDCRGRGEEVETRREKEREIGREREERRESGSERESERVAERQRQWLNESSKILRICATCNEH